MFLGWLAFLAAGATITPNSHLNSIIVLLDNCIIVTVQDTPTFSEKEGLQNGYGLQLDLKYNLWLRGQE